AARPGGAGGRFACPRRGVVERRDPRTLGAVGGRGDHAAGGGESRGPGGDRNARPWAPATLPDRQRGLRGRSPRALLGVAGASSDVAPGAPAVEWGGCALTHSGDVVLRQVARGSREHVGAYG